VKVVVTGASGMLGRDLVRCCAEAGHATVPLARSDLDVTDEARTRARVRDADPDVVFHCAAFTAVDAAESDEGAALRVNADGALYVARAAAEAGARMVYLSSDYVFDGRSARPYRVDDTPAPLNAYGRTKLAGELAVRGRDALVVRTSWLFGAGGRNFVATVLDRARAGEPLRVVDDQVGSPTWTADLAAMLIALVEAGAAPGVYHAANAGAASWFELASEAIRLAGLDAPITPVPTSAVQRPAARPAYSVLDCITTYAVSGPARPWRDALAAAIAAGLGAAGGASARTEPGPGHGP
jgi:dTDP-4-dehydrorhamnose reductase